MLGERHSLMPEHRLQRTREAYQDDKQAFRDRVRASVARTATMSSKEMETELAAYRLRLAQFSPFPPNREVRDGGETRRQRYAPERVPVPAFVDEWASSPSLRDRVDTLIAWLKRQAGRF